MITVKIDEDTTLDMLMDRVKVWRSDEATLELFEKMYESYIDSGCFNGSEFDVMQIVDNDIVNWCDVIYEDDEDFEKLLELYKQGERDVSCENFSCGANFIEAVNSDKTAILIRY